MVGQGLVPEGHHPLTDQIPTEDLGEYLQTIETLYTREAERMPRHEEFIARHCAAPALEVAL